MGSVVPPSPVRPSLTERDQVAARLRAAREEDRLSIDTFAARLDRVYAARSESELEALVGDLPDAQLLTRCADRATAWASSWASRFAEAWRRPRVQPLVLPTRESVLLGRSRACDCVVTEASVSRRHAQLTYRDGTWRLQDLASLNGTFLNGARVIDEIEVAPGDELRFGRVRFRVTPPPPRLATKVPQL